MQERTRASFQNHDRRATLLGDPDGDEFFNELYALGARSISIWSGDGDLVWDSGDELEQLTAAALPDWFNSNNDENGFDSRSDDKGPEPEGVTVGSYRGRTYAFACLERIGGIVVYDVTDPEVPQFVQYFNTRVFDPDDEDNVGPDSGPEALQFLGPAQSPTRHPMLVVSHEVTGTVTLLEFR